MGTKQPSRAITVRVSTTGENSEKQVITLESVDLYTTINDLKEIVKEKINVAPNKQRFILDGIGFLKDTQTLAYYNLANNAEITLAVKDRKKKK